MRIPLSYSLRNLWTRRLTTALTAGGMALVVFVYAAVLMLDEGLKKTLVDTGEFDNVVVIRKGSGNEVQSGVERSRAALVESQPQVALGPDGTPMSSKEAVVLITLPKRGTDKPSNVVIRGIESAGLTLRPQVRLVRGRMFRPGSAEVIAGRSIAERFDGGGVGETLRFGGREWAVVGMFDAGRTGFDSEIWGDVDLMMGSFRRLVYSSVIVRLARSEHFEPLREAIEGDPRIKLELKRETQYYADQSEALSRFLRILGITLSAIFSIGAIIGAMITMYAAVANRTGEIGTLRAIGFRKSAVMMAFLAESLLLSLLGGVAGLMVASFMQLYTISTMNWQSFSELAFSFRLTPAIIAQSLAFSLIMGLIGGFLPAARAAGMNITEALRSA